MNDGVDYIVFSQLLSSDSTTPVSLNLSLIYYSSVLLADISINFAFSLILVGSSLL